MTDITNHVRGHLERLCAIGPKPIGSAGIHEAESYIDEVFTNSGLIVERQEFDCHTWCVPDVALTVNGVRLPVMPNTFTTDCDICAPAVALADIADLEKSDLSGRIAVLYGSLSAEPLAPKNFTFWNPQEHQKIIKCLEEKRPEAIITISPLVFNPVPVIEDWDFKIPSVTVPAKAGLSLLGNLGQTIRLNVAGKQTEPSRSANVIGRTARPSKKKVVVCAHYDTKYDTPGAFDNASGTAALLTLAETLQDKDLPVNLEFIAFAGEECYALGELMYLEKSKEELASITAAINIDGVGLVPSRNSVAFFDWPDRQAIAVPDLMARFPELVQVDPWPQGDHTIFWMQGIPCVAVSADLSSKHIVDLIQTISHTQEDTIDWVSPEKVAQAVIFVQQLAAALAADDC